MLDKKVTRKEFLLGVLAIAGVVVASKLPSVIHNTASFKKDNTYGNYSYGGKKNTRHDA